MFFEIKIKIWTRLFLIYVLDDSEDTLYIFCTYTFDYKHMVAPNSLIINYYYYYYYWHPNSKRKKHCCLTKPNKRNKRISKAD